MRFGEHIEIVLDDDDGFRATAVEAESFRWVQRISELGRLLERGASDRGDP